MRKPDSELVVDIQKIDEERLAGKGKLYSSLFLGGVLLMVYIAVAVHYMYKPANPMGKIIYIEPQKPTPVTDAGLNQALDYAVAAWSKSLGYQVKKPLLKKDDNNCEMDFGGGVIACADAATYSIMVRSIYYADPKTIMMHEMGHLLGVPHISQDPLMDAIYQGPVTEPTPWSVAIAKTPILRFKVVK